MDARTAQVLDEPKADQGFMYVMLKLHTDMFAGLPGMLFLGFMGLLMVVAIVSGVVLYAPFMRRLEFGTVRRQKAARTRWLDWHNLLGVVTTAWVLVVGVTGIVNTLAVPITTHWKDTALMALVDAEDARPFDPANRASLDQAVRDAQAALPAPKESMIDLQRIEGQVRDSSIKKVGEVVGSHPEEALAIIRTWLHEPA